MKISILLILLSILCFSFQAVSGPSGPSKQAIILVDESIHPINQLTLQLDKLMTKIQQSGEHDNFILFIHGRGNHPKKAFEDSLLLDLESNYSAKVIMFHWPSKSRLGFPQDKAKAAADDFLALMTDLKRYKHNHPDKIHGVKFTLLTHSMGSIVLENAVQNEHEEEFKDVFDTIAISAAASPAKQQAKWLNKLNWGKNIYITVNNDDKVLKSAGVQQRSRRLGNHLTKRNGSAFVLADNVQYIDVTNSSVNHRYYVHRKLTDEASVKKFFDQVLNGNPANLQDQTCCWEKNHNIFVLRKEN